MGLLRSFSLVIVTLQFYGNSAVSAYELPQMKQKSTTSVFTRSQTFSPSRVLSESMVERFPFTSEGVEPTPNVLRGDVGHFTIVQVKTTKTFEKGKTAYALQKDVSGESGYWLPLQSTIDIPTTPNNYEPKYVFTPDFVGGSISVTPLNSSTLRLQRKEVQSNNFLGNIYSMGNSFAYIHFSGGEWLLHIQNRTCTAAKPIFNSKSRQLQSIKMSYYDMKTSVEVFRVSNGGYLIKSQVLLCSFIFIAILVNLM